MARPAPLPEWQRRARIGLRVAKRAEAVAMAGAGAAAAAAAAVSLVREVLSIGFVGQPPKAER